MRAFLARARREIREANPRPPKEPMDWTYGGRIILGLGALTAFFSVIGYALK